MRRSRRQNRFERALKWLAVRPVRCRDCQVRLWQFAGYIWDGKLSSLILFKRGRT